MSIPDAAIEAAAPEIQRVIEGWMNYDDEDWTVLARTAIAAAMPAIREHIAQEIDAEAKKWLPHSISRHRFDQAARIVFDQAARIVRGGTP